jgi:beta-glucosidase
MRKFTRRQFGTGVAATAAAALASASLPRFALGQARSTARAFPEGFLWGCATASYQIEGGAAEDGRGPSVWDVFSHKPGITVNGDTGDVADNSYHLYKEDVRLLKNLGVATYRMSISWSRIFPQGTGKPNPKGLDYYNRVVDELLANKITPYVTLFHWDLPQAMQDRVGGWQSRDTSKAFAEYAAYVTRHLGDKVHHWMTTNEFVCFTDLGYQTGRFAPGLKVSPAQVNQVRHHAILAHGLGVQAIRANASSGAQVGLAENTPVFVPVIESPEHIEAARKATQDAAAPFLAPLMEGKYSAGYLEREGANAPHVEPGDMEAIGSKLDFVGLNIYTADYVQAAASPKGYAIVPRPTSFPHMGAAWINVVPECAYWSIRNVTDLWHPSALFISENGCASDDVPNAAGEIEDIDRVMYLRNHITNVHRAVTEGYPIKGYFLWSLLDNFEWCDGYSKRFGIHYVDFKTEKRTPKLSGKWYRQVIARNALE